MYDLIDYCKILVRQTFADYGMYYDSILVETTAERICELIQQISPEITKIKLTRYFKTYFEQDSQNRFTIKLFINFCRAYSLKNLQNNIIINKISEKDEEFLLIANINENLRQFFYREKDEVLNIRNVMHDYLIKTGYLKENEYKKYQKAAEKEFKSFKYERNAVKKAFMPKNVIDVAKKMYLNDILNQYRKQNEMIQL